MLDKLYLEWVFRPDAVLVGLIATPAKNKPHSVSYVTYTLYKSTGTWVSQQVPHERLPSLIPYDEFIHKVDNKEILLTGVVGGN